MSVAICPRPAAVAALAEVAPAPPARRYPIPGGFGIGRFRGAKRDSDHGLRRRREGGAVGRWSTGAGQGHLGRLPGLALAASATCLELDGNLCAEGEALARRAGVDQRFVAADALRSAVPQGRRACRRAARLQEPPSSRAGGRHRAGVAAFDIAPCCYHRGVERPIGPCPGVSLLSPTMICAWR